MRLTTKKIEEILVNLLGEDALPLIRQLCSKSNVSEFELAAKTKKDIKVIRKMLYLLYNHNLVGFTRKKDTQKGWYIYYWTLLPESIKFNYFKTKRDLLEKIKQQLASEEKGLFFTCPHQCIRLDFDQSLDFEFHCPECGELISQDDQQKKAEELKKMISKVETELESFKEQKGIKRNAVKKHRKETKIKKRERTSRKTTPSKYVSSKTVMNRKKKIKH